MEQEIGKVSHFFDKAMVAAIKLTGDLAVGDKIKIKRGGQEFEETVGSMQIERESVEKAKAGDEVGIKVSEATKEGATVFKVE